MEIFFETERLLLRRWKPDDLRGLIEINRDPEVMEYFPKPLSEAESTDFYGRIVREFDETGYGLYAVETRAGGEFIGYTGFHRPGFEAEFTPCVEIGWRLKRAAWGRGYATEGASACLRYGFGRLDLPEIYSFTTVTNRRSERVMQKTGMRKISEFAHPLLESGHPLIRHVLYRITGTEWNVLETDESTGKQLR